MTHYELLTPCTCGDESCTSREVTSILIEPAPPSPYIQGVFTKVWYVNFDQDEIWARRIIQYGDDEETAVRYAVTRVFGEDAFEFGTTIRRQEERDAEV